MNTQSSTISSRKTTRKNTVMLPDVSESIRTATLKVGQSGCRVLVSLFLMVAIAPQAMAAAGIETLQLAPSTKRIGLDAHFVDLRVASFGDDLAISREWIDGEWVWNKAWRPVRSQGTPRGSAITGDGVGMVQPDPAPWYRAHDSVQKYKAVFDSRSGGGAGTTYVLRAKADAPGEHVELHSDGLIWRDRNGNWIKYAPEDVNQIGIYGGPRMSAYIHSYGNALYTNSFVLDSENRVQQVKDTFGNLLLTLSYLGATDLPTRIEDYSGRAVGYSYNSDNQLIEVTDVRGQVWKYSYTEKGQPSSLEDPNGNATQYQYSNNSITVVSADQLKTVYRYEYDKAHDKLRRTEERPDGSVRESIYNNGTNVPNTTPRYERYADGQLVSQRFGSQANPRIVDAAGEETVYEKNEYQKTTRVTYQDGTDEQWIHSSDGRYQRAYMDRKGVRTEWDYDDKDRVTEVRRAAGLPEQQTIRYSYPDLQTRITTVLGDQYTPAATTTETFDQYGNTVSITDAEGHTASYTYNALGQVITETLPSGAQYSYEYDPAGNVSKVIDPLRRMTIYSYDGTGNLITEIWSNSATTTHSYNALNQKVGTTNARNETVETIYDRASRTFTFKDAKGAQTKVQMNAQGLPTVIEDPNGNQTQQTYDNDRLVSSQHPTFEQTYEYASGSRLKRITDHYDGKQSSTGLKVDPLGQVIEQTDANNNPEQRQYDSFGQLTEITDALGGITRLTYDVHGNLVKVTDPEGRETRFEYDGNGQVTAEERQPTPSQVSRRSYQYDADGNLATEITPNGEKAVYSYSSAGELVNVELFADQASATPKQTISLTYSDLGQLTSYDDGETQGTYSYDDVGQLLTATTDYGPFAKSISYTYDAAGNIATYTNPEGVIYTYNYDDGGLIRSINIPGTGLIAFSEYQWTQPTRITLPGGSVIERQYDGLQRMASNTLMDPAQSALMTVLYGYDPVGNILSQGTEHGDYTYGYDSLNRLTKADYPTANDETFDYDGVGNRTGHNGDSSWTYNEANQLTHQSDTSYEYDANGHLIKKTVMGQDTHFVYNSQERLVQVEDHNRQVVARYGYNPFGHRLWKEVGGERTYFFHNHSGLVGEYNIAGELIKEYQYTPKSTWMTNPLFQRAGGSLYFYQNDHLGTPQRLMANSGQVVWEARSQAFGYVDEVQSKITNPLRFPGQYYDQETGLHHNYFRDYDPSLGRYLQIDPVGFRGGVNVYLYVYSNPLNMFDDAGTTPVHAIGAAAGGLASLVLNYRAYQCGNMSIWGWLGSGVVGAAAGGISAGASVWSGMGAASAASVAESYITGGSISGGGIVTAAGSALAGGLVGKSVRFFIPKVRKAESYRTFFSWPPLKKQRRIVWVESPYATSAESVAAGSVVAGINFAVSSASTSCDPEPEVCEAK